jgi:DNA-binding SARP family transcriptional activator/tetratricopeptide (TPR) repeat protein
LVELCLLGSIEVRLGGVPVAIGPLRRQALLAALAVDAGRVVPTQVLIERVWGSEAGEASLGNLYSYVNRLRLALRRAGVAEESLRLARRPGGYQLEVDPGRVDVCRFRQLTERARAGTGRRRADLLDQAVRLWRGQPLLGVGGAWAERTRRQLVQEHLDALLLWAAAELAVGEPGLVVDRLRPVVEQHPLVEPAAARLIEALARDGRGAEALERYAATRQRLVDELGTEPGIELRRLHEALLAGELDRRDPPSSPPLAQLPRPVAGFTGRQAELAALDRLLERAGGAGGVDGAGGQPVTVLIAGTAGIGKTALAVHWAHRVAGRFPDGQLYVNLRGFDPAGAAVEPGEVVRRFIDALGVPADRVPADPEAQAALYRSLLAGKRVLVVLDNARGVEQVQPLVPGAPTACVVVTSRSQLTPLVATAGAYPLTVGPLTTAEGRELLERRLTPARVAAEPAAAAKIVTACAWLPLALCVAAARAARTGLPLAALAAELADAHGRLGALDAGSTATRLDAVFSWSYETLSPAAARLFRLLGLHPGPDISLAAAASLTGEPVDGTRGQLAELVGASLVSEHAPGRYVLHDLLAAYARGLAERVDPAARRHAATVRLLDHLLHSALPADRLLDPGRAPCRIPPAPPASGSVIVEPAGEQAALSWLTAEHQVLLAALRLAAAAGLDTHTWQLAWVLDTMLQRRGYWADAVAAWQAAAAGADRRCDRSSAGYARRNLGRACILLGDHEAAEDHLRASLEAAAADGDRAAQAYAHRALAHLYDARQQPGLALEHSEEALAHFRAAGDRRGEAYALNAAGWCRAVLADYPGAISRCEQAQELFGEVGDDYGAAVTWDSLGYAHHHLGRYAQAAGCYERAVALAHRLGDRYGEATALTHLGDTRAAADDRPAARDAWSHALSILTDLGHADTAELRARLDGA